MKQESAEVIAIQALGWLAGNDELLPVFLGSTGASAQDIAARAGEPEFLGSVLDFLLMDDAWVVGFCDAAGVAYDRVAPARMALPGGNLPNWT